MDTPNVHTSRGLSSFWGKKLSEQLELFTNAPFTLRLTIGEALRLFQEFYWNNLPKAKTTKQCFVRILEFCRLKQVNYVDEFSKTSMEDLRRWLGSQGLKPSTVNTHHVIITRLFNKLEEWKESRIVNGVDFSKITLPTKNPGSKVPKVNEQQFAEKSPWPKKVIFKFIEAAVTLNDLDLAEDLEMLYLTSLRPSDLYRITEKNVDLAHMILTGTQHKTVTTRLPSGKPFLLALTPRMITIIKRRIERIQPGQPLFGNPKYTHEAWMRGVNRRFSVVKGYLGMPHVKIKHMRGSSTTLLIDNKVDIETVRERGGWSTYRMMPVYGPRKIQHQREAQEVLEMEETEILM